MWVLLVQKEKVKNHIYETDEKMEMAKQDTTKTSFLTLSGSKISIMVASIVPKPEGDYDVSN